MRTFTPRPAAVAAALLAAAAAFAAAPARATTIFGSNDLNTEGAAASNANVGTTYGSNVTAASAIAVDSDLDGRTNATVSAGAAGVVGTPDIALNWNLPTGPTSGAGRWQFHSVSAVSAAITGGGALQLDGSAVSTAYSVTLTPTAAAAVVVNSFRFLGDTNNDTYAYDWRVVRTADAAVVANGSTGTWTTAIAASPNTGAPSVSVGFTGDLGTPYRLEFARTGGTGSGSNVDVYVDNLSIDQVPEPSAAVGALVVGGGFLGTRRRRRQHV